MIVTVAFELGNDFPDIASVINWGAPQKLQDFYQQADRAGNNYRKTEPLVKFINIGKVNNKGISKHQPRVFRPQNILLLARPA